jgi:ATP-dependent helicase YprA (DUF1998 family)
METINPIEVSKELRTTYGRYLETLVEPRDEGVRAALKSAIRDAETGPNSLVKGPFLEAQPPYVKGSTIRKLVETGLLSKSFLTFPTTDLPIDRPLYAHQEQAIQRVGLGNSIVVATGTGSGKTESFLLPIINELFIEKELGKLGAGVRALLLYPMNALANDQVKRLRKLLANQPQITFGRYTGETPNSHEAALEKFRAREGKDPLPNELISREQIRETPPNILLTNYAMLEYLLLRPADTALFEGPSSDTWKFIVADEAHTYDGAHGIEVAYLLRKLRNRVDKASKIITIGTTATIGKDKDGIREFAESFFGNKFNISPSSSPDLIEPKRMALPDGAYGPLPENEWITADREDSFGSLVSDGVSSFEFISQERSFVRLRNFLAGGPSNIEKAAQEIWPGSELGPEAVLSMVNLGARIKDVDGEPALSARFHVIARASEGVFSCLRPQPHLSLVRHEACPDCEAPTFELAGCKKCGAEYYAGSKLEIGGKIFFSPSNSNKPISVAFHSIADTEQNEDELVYDEEFSDEAAASQSLCISCGLFIQGLAPSCPSCESQDIREVLVLGDRPERLTKCSHCGSRGRAILRRLESGGDAAAAVLATELYGHLPPDPDVSAEFPGGGRKLMVFSDSRQQAAYFAPYVDETYGSILWRKIIYQALLKFRRTAPNPDDVRLVDLEQSMVELAAEASLFPSDMYGNERYKYVREQLQLEIVSTDRSINLEGTNLISWELSLPENDAQYAGFADFGIDPPAAKALVRLLLTQFRESGAITAPDGVDQASDAFAPRRGPLYIRQGGAAQVAKTYSWLPAANKNGRTDLATRVLKRTKPDGDVHELLKNVWRMLTESDAFKNIFVASNSNQNGIRFQLNHKMLVVKPVSPSDPYFECDVCKRVTADNVASVCPRFQCEGQLKAVQAAEITRAAHYRRLYSEGEILGMVAREHTAQLSDDEAANVQSDFIEGKVNLLSSSTTFELGVDVGELQSVFLRNVPPATANYLQRAGRAGRRSDSAALILTYAQKRPHDLAKFADPVSLIAGQMRAPYVDLENARILIRHMYSIFFAAFWRENPAAFSTAEGLAIDEIDGATNLHRIREWVTANESTLLETFVRILPDSLDHKKSEIWTETLKTFDELVADVQSAFGDYVQEYKTLITSYAAQSADMSFSAAQRGRAGAIVSRLNRELESIIKDDAISFLSKRNLMPKYGFPVDTVNLTPRMDEPGSSQVDLSRDLALAIFDYAPGAQVIANKQIWESVGIATVPGKDVEYKKFVQCYECAHLTIQIAVDETQITECKACGSTQLSSTSTYMIPKWGFLAKKSETKSTSSVAKRSWNRDLFLAESGEVDIEHAPRVKSSKVKAELQKIAKLLIVNNGGANSNGYKICKSCHAASENTGVIPKKHKHPIKPDADCTGHHDLGVKLGHMFETDLVQVRFDIQSTATLDTVEIADSVEQAVIQAASDLIQINRDDIDIVHLSSSAQHIEFAIVDAVPAGAGFAPMIGSRLQEVIEHALRIVERCNCGEETSCYQCLRTYSNQRIHEKLRRDWAIAGLSTLK